MRSTPTINEVSMIKRYKSSGLLSVVGYSLVKSVCSARDSGCGNLGYWG